jgi:antirestriction protein ArdC
MQRTEKQDIYTRITNQIVSHLEKGVRPWVRPWNAEHAAGRITCPLRHNGKPYSGINVLSLWASAMAQNFSAPIWMTFKQASELDAHIRKGAVMRSGTFTPKSLAASWVPAKTLRQESVRQSDGKMENFVFWKSTRLSARLPFRLAR